MSFPFDQTVLSAKFGMRNSRKTGYSILHKVKFNLLDNFPVNNSCLVCLYEIAGQPKAESA